jgi:hypothetical protein
MKKIYIVLWVVVLITTGTIAYVVLTDPEADINETSGEDLAIAKNEVYQLPVVDLNTDTSLFSIDRSQILRGTLSNKKDVIPALSNPKFDSVNEVSYGDDELGILVSFDNEDRYYPYSILVQHEIVNDSIEQNDFSVTFCPLCGSALVFNQYTEHGKLTFGVSGMLFQSNLLMYDHQTESLWSQARGEAVMGELLGTKLEIIDTRLVTFEKLKSDFPNAKVLSQDTGYNRNYDLYPYGDYNNNDDFLFQTDEFSSEFNPKELMYVIPRKDGSVAIPFLTLAEQTGRYSFEVYGENLDLSFEDGEPIVTSNETKLPGYYEMWFSWYIHNGEGGVVWEF